MLPETVWYAAYGTNLDPGRLRLYLEGGTPEGASLATPGARDPAPPQDERPVELAGSVYFAWESPTWGGGVAFYDPGGHGGSVARAYLLTVAQFSDVAAQEMHRPPGADLDLTALLEAGTATLGPGRYETLHVVGSIDGDPVVTFTASEDGSPPYNAPAPAYLATMARGLRATWGWDTATVAAYLGRRPGIGTRWTTERLLDLVDGAHLGPAS